MIKPLVESLCDASTDGYLIPGLKPGGPDGKRGWQQSNRFTRLRRRLKIEREGVTFHSLRNTFTTALEEAARLP